MNFAQNLKVLRDQKHISQARLALQLKVVTQTVGSWEVDRTEPNFRTLCALADYFDVSTDQLLGRASLPETVPQKAKVHKVCMARRR